MAGCRAVAHVAADYRLWVPDPETMVRANVDGTRALLLAAKAAGVERIVYCSSVAALGLTTDGTPADEATPVDPAKVIGAYKRSKWEAQRAVLDLARDGVPVVVVNPSAPVGPRDVKPTPTGKMILDAAAGKMPAYVDTGLNVVHVDDVGEGHALALERGRVGECYILGGEDLAMPALLALIDEVVGRRAQRRAAAARRGADARGGRGGGVRAGDRAHAVRDARHAGDGAEDSCSSAPPRRAPSWATRLARRARPCATRWLGSEARGC